MKNYIYYAIVFLVILQTSILTFAEEVASDRDPFQSQSASALQTLPDGSLSLNFTDAPIVDVLQLLAHQAKQNIVLSDAVQGHITLQLRQVSWQQALHTVLQLKNLTAQQQGNVLMIDANPAANEKTASLSTVLIKIHYAKATDLAALLKNANGSVLSKQGHVNADPRTNTLWVQDVPPQLPQIQQLIASLDVPLKQVLIKARIVSVNQDCLQELGVRFGTVTTGDSLNLGGLAMDMPVAIPQNGRFNIALAKLGPNTLLDLELSALESEGRGKVISSPELTTADRNAAYIEAGEEVPYQERTTSGATSVAFKKAVLSLKVVPQIVKPQQLILNLTVNQDKLSSFSVQGVPVIQTREIETQVAVNSGETVVLGGIYEQTHHQALQRIPFLSDIPVIGHLFQDQTTRTDRRELLIFVTPQILS